MSTERSHMAGTISSVCFGGKKKKNKQNPHMANIFTMNEILKHVKYTWFDILERKHFIISI